MDARELERHLTSLGIPRNHATVGLSNYVASSKQVQTLFIHRRLPDAGWADLQIQHLLLTLSSLDTSSPEPCRLAVPCGGGFHQRWVGVGEREGRVHSSLVSQRHYGLSHGIGRSGDVTEPQPKAAGSSAIARLALALALDAVRRGAGLEGRAGGPARCGVLLPLCTGMSMGLVLAALRDGLPADQRIGRTVVLWSRIDQKSCFKAVLSAGLECVVVPTRLNGGGNGGGAATDEVVTDLDAMASLLEEYRGRVLAVITTTSCFAPRVPDAVDEVARLVAREAEHLEGDASGGGVAHIINHAYGLQCRDTCKLLNRACAVGRVDAVVCSTDKNFLVPVGGALVLSPDEKVVASVGKVYPGRASGAPVLDLLATLLGMGLGGYRSLLERRTGLVDRFRRSLAEVAERHGERPLLCPRNSISCGITLDGLGPDPADITYLGSMLFTRCVSGTRVVPRGVSKTMGGQQFVGFGSSVDGYPHAYLTAACAIGLGEAEADEFFARLDRTLRDCRKKKDKGERDRTKRKQEKETAAGAAEGDKKLSEGVGDLVVSAW